MIKPAPLLLGAAMVATTAGTYFGLELLPPGTIPPPIGRLAPEHSERAVARPDPAPIVVAAAAATMPVTAQAEPEVAAPEPAPVTPPPATEAASAPATPAPQPATLKARAPADSVAVDPAPAAVTASPEPLSAPASAEPVSEPATTETAAATPASTPAAEADAVKPWWPDPATIPANQLKLQYAGPVKGQGAIALLFSAPPKVETLQQHAQVKSASGEAVPPNWSLGKNPKLAVLGGLAPGRYTVILQPQVADEKGFMLGTTLAGPVYVKAQ